MPGSPAAIARQKEVASLAVCAERVSQRMLDRSERHTGSTIVMSMDEYAEIGVTMCRLTGTAKELHGLIVGGAPTRDELIHLCGNITMAGAALAAVADGVKSIVDRMNTAPQAEGDLRL